MRVNVIVAGACTDVALNARSTLGIGVDNSLPWHMPNEFKHFVKCTTHVDDESKMNVVIMGRKVWDSIPSKFRPLRKRVNIVLSKTMSDVNLPENVHVCRSFEHAEDVVRSLDDTIETVWNIGGRDLYKYALDSCDLHRIYVTHIHTPFDTCNVFFPAVDWTNDYRRVADHDDDHVVHEENRVKYSFLVYERTSK